MATLDLADARHRYENAIAPEDFDRLPFYAALLRALARDQRALEMLASTRREQRNPMLILAVLHWLALEGHPVLGPMYENVRGAQSVDVDEAVRTILRVLHEDASLVSQQLGRSTQTNEPGRGALLQAVIADLAKSHDRINLLDVGCSAGINLHLDRFSVSERQEHNPFMLHCRDVGGPYRRDLPTIDQRVGIDPRPLRLTNREDQRWLKACLWPEDHHRHERFDAIVAAWPTWTPLDLLTGSARERLHEGLEQTSGAFTVIVNTWVLFYLSDDERHWFLSTVHAAARAGGVATVSIESPQVAIPDFATDQRAHQPGASQIVVAREFARPELWGWCHPHGRWLERAAGSNIAKTVQGDFGPQ